MPLYCGHYLYTVFIYLVEIIVSWDVSIPLKNCRSLFITFLVSVLLACQFFLICKKSQPWKLDYWFYRY
jgi:hypothetical protein